MRCAVSILIAGAFAAACAQTSGPKDNGPEPSEARHSAGMSSGPRSSEASPDTESGSLRDRVRTAVPVRHRLRPQRLDHSPAGDKEFIRAADGSTLVIFGTVGSHPHLWTRFRIYGPGWKPLTPFLQVQVSLEITAALRHAFLGKVLVVDRDAKTLLQGHVLLRKDGTLNRVHATKQPDTLERGDQVFLSSAGKFTAYRRSTGQLLKVRKPRNAPPPSASPWWFSQSGDACSLASGRGGEVAYWTFDRGQSWHRRRTAQLTAARRKASMCEARRDRLVLVQSGQYGPTRAVTVVLSQPRSVTSYRLDRRFAVSDFQYQAFVLHDGRLVFRTLRPGLMVATDSLNSGFEFRAAPVDWRTSIQVLGRELVIDNCCHRRNRLDVSTDAARTWHTVDLRAGGWTATD